MLIFLLEFHISRSFSQISFDTMLISLLEFHISRFTKLKPNPKKPKPTNEQTPIHVDSAQFRPQSVDPRIIFLSFDTGRPTLSRNNDVEFRLCGYRKVHLKPWFFSLHFLIYHLCILWLICILWELTMKHNVKVLDFKTSFHLSTYL